MNSASSTPPPIPKRASRKPDVLCAILILTGAGFLLPPYFRSHRKESIRFQQVVKKKLPSGATIEKFVGVDEGDYFEVTLNDEQFTATFPAHQSQALPLAAENAADFITSIEKTVGTVREFSADARYYRQTRLQIVREPKTGRTLIYRSSDP